ncbi:MAG: hypothetical protein HYV03_03290, partial [Deltaproteobacteria bacterium]|nr:hypothetical protein [Deltaproteobacteria bacterium]
MKSLCFRCFDPAATGTARPQESVCLDLWPLEPTPARMRRHRSLYLVEDPPSRAPTEAITFEVTTNGKPFTSSDLALVCGSPLPALWHPRSITVFNAEDAVGMDGLPLFPGALLTVDGAAYTLTAERLAWRGTRATFLANQERHAQLQTRLEWMFAQWMTPSVYAGCAVEQPLETPISQECRTPNVGDDFATLVEKAVAMIKTDYKKPVVVQACASWPQFTASAVILPAGPIQIYHNIVDHVIYANTFEADRILGLGMLIAHEMGHLLHLTDAGVGGAELLGHARRWGLPPFVAGVLLQIMAERELPEPCMDLFLDWLRTKEGLESPNPFDFPLEYELVAFLHEYDTIVRHRPALGATNYRLTNGLWGLTSGSLETIREALTRGYHVFPEAAGDLGLLIDLIRQHPVFAQGTKSFGASLLLQVLSDLAPEAV